MILLFSIDSVERFLL